MGTLSFRATRVLVWLDGWLAGCLNACPSFSASKKEKLPSLVHLSARSFGDYNEEPFVDVTLVSVEHERKTSSATKKRKQYTCERSQGLVDSKNGVGDNKECHLLGCSAERKRSSAVAQHRNAANTVNAEQVAAVATRNQLPRHASRACLENQPTPTHVTTRSWHHFPFSSSSLSLPLPLCLSTAAATVVSTCREADIP